METNAVFIKDLTFAWPASRMPILKIGKLNIPKASRILIQGPSGSGKTIITQLMQGLYNPTSGKVFIDGKDLRTIKLQHLLGRVG